MAPLYDRVVSGRGVTNCDSHDGAERVFYLAAVTRCRVVQVVVDVCPVRPPAGERAIRRVVNVPRFAPNVAARAPNVNVLVQRGEDGEFCSGRVVATTLTRVLRSMVRDLYTNNGIFVMVLVNLRRADDRGVRFRVLGANDLRLVGRGIGPQRHDQDYEVRTANAVRFPFLPVRFRVELAVLMAVVTFGVPFVIKGPIVR